MQFKDTIFMGIISSSSKNRKWHNGIIQVNMRGRNNVKFIVKTNNLPAQSHHASALGPTKQPNPEARD